MAISSFDAIYPIVYLDCIVVKIRQDKRVINKSIFLALGINTEGHKELMGMWIAEMKAQNLAKCPDGTSATWCGRYSDRMCGWSKGVPRGH